MKKIMIMLLLSILFTVAPTKRSHAVIWIVIKAALKKVIKAIDLAIQAQQNKIIWLQNAQKELENTMSKLQLDEITDWVEKQRNLYRDYFEELQKVKTIITYYDRVRQVTTLQEKILGEYQRSFALFKRDNHFSVEEITYMGRVYDGMLAASVKSLDQLFLVINSFVTQMTDAKRLEIIGAAAGSMQAIYNDLKRFNGQNSLLSLQRARNQHEIALTKALYNLP